MRWTNVEYPLLGPPGVRALLAARGFVGFFGEDTSFHRASGRARRRTDLASHEQVSSLVTTRSSIYHYQTLLSYHS